MTSDAKAIINGKGVNESEKLKIFEPYYTTKSDANATGIGLTVCQSIIQAHEGSIIVESTAGKGTSVYVALPALINTGESDFKDISNEINEKAIEILILNEFLADMQGLEKKISSIAIGVSGSGVFQ